MDEAMIQTESRIFKRNVTEQKPLMALLSDVNSLALTDLTLLAACDTLASTCESLIHIHGGPSSRTDQRSQDKETSTGATYTDTTLDYERERGEGESADEISTEIPAHATKSQTSRHNIINLEVANRPRPISPMTDKALFQRIEMLHKSSFDNEAYKAKIETSKSSHSYRHSSQNKQRAKHNSNAQKKNVLLNNRRNEINASTHHGPKTYKNEFGLLKRIDTSTELTSKLNHSMDILRRELDKIFDSSLDIADSKPKRLDVSVYCDLDQEAPLTCVSPLAPLNLSDQGYFSDGNTLDSWGIHKPTFSKARGLPSTWDTTEVPLSPQRASKGPYASQPCSPTSPQRLYPEGIVRDPYSPRSAFKKVVRFS